jgi:threonyl-tRNA synthetase
MRVRGFTQDDTRIFCCSEQVHFKAVKVCSELLKEVYSKLGFTEMALRFSDRQKNRVGNGKVWERDAVA